MADIKLFMMKANGHDHGTHSDEFPPGERIKPLKPATDLFPCSLRDPNITKAKTKVQVLPIKHNSTDWQEPAML